MKNIDLTTEYLGLKLRNPIVIASSGLTNSVQRVKEFEEHGAGAVVLKSVFEEEITLEHESILRDSDTSGLSDETLDYLDVRIKEEKLDKYIQLIKSCKEEVYIPVIASINCSTKHEWIYFAQQCQAAGADAIELNMFLSPANPDSNSAEMEKLYLEIALAARQEISIPVALKVSYHFTALANMLTEFDKIGIDGIVIFNRFFNPDFDIDKFEITSENVLSQPSDLGLSLRWVALMSNKLNCSLSGTTGIHDGKSIIKQLLAGADTVQIASVLYQHGAVYIEDMLDELERWMQKKSFTKVNDFRGKMSYKKVARPDLLERAQFMKYFSNKDNPQ